LQQRRIQKRYPTCANLLFIAWPFPAVVVDRENGAGRLRSLFRR
jgi:hypothetical protein